MRMKRKRNEIIDNNLSRDDTDSTGTHDDLSKISVRIHGEYHWNVFWL